jgi:phosphohistidine phosphatase
MRVYILRHGKAEKDSDSGRDEDRALAERGRAQAQGLAEMWLAKKPPKEMGQKPALILSSAAARADATARIIAKALGLKVTHEDGLGLDATMKEALALVEGLAERPQPALLVGHNPLLSRLVDHLGGGDEDLRTGEMAALELVEHTLEGREVARLRCDD